MLRLGIKKLTTSKKCPSMEFFLVRERTFLYSDWIQRLRVYDKKRLTE